MNTEPRTTTMDDYKRRILRVLVHIQQHLDDAVSLDDLAAVANFSPFHFHRIFRGMMGESVMEHIRRLRLERAAYRLKTTDQPVVRIAFDAGYETHESFTRAFGVLFGDSPSKYRRLHQPAAPAAPAATRVHYLPDAQLEDLDIAIKGESDMNVEIEHIEPMRVAFIRHIGPYDQVGGAWSRLMAWAGRKGAMGPMMKFFGFCHDDPDVTPAERIRYDACIVVTTDVEAEGEIGIQTVAGGDFATTIHHGPYQKLGETYSRLCGQWIPASGRHLGDPPSIERYLNDPRGTPEDQLLTQICMRLA